MLLVQCQYLMHQTQWVCLKHACYYVTMQNLKEAQLSDFKTHQLTMMCYKIHVAGVVSLFNALDAMGLFETRQLSTLLGSVEQFKITFVIAHLIPDRILRIVESERIVIHLYSLATNLNTNKPIDIQSRPNINEQQHIGEKMGSNYQ